MNHVCHEAAGLDDYLCPAFTVSDGIIRRLNHAACYIGLTEQMPVSSLLHAPEDYADYEDGCLYLSLSVGTTDYSATVCKKDGCDLFLLDHQLEQQLWTFSLVSQQLRTPLSNVMTIAEQLLKELPEGSEYAGEMRRSLNQLHRMTCNMSDAGRYSCETTAHQSTIDMAALINEVMEKVCSLAEQKSIRVLYEPLRQPVISLADAEMVERAVLNLMSNALKATPAGGSIRTGLSVRNDKLLFQVCDGGAGMDSDIRSAAFSQYLRRPSPTGFGQGLGLGLVIVRSAAIAHGGTVLLEHPQNEGMRVTVSFAIRKSSTLKFSSPVILGDYAGERDHALLELSDVLPAEAYKTE